MEFEEVLTVHVKIEKTIEIQSTIVDSVLMILFTAAKSDFLVPVDQYTKATYDRLVKAGAKNVQMSLFDKVVDKTGLYKNKDGAPYEYFGHFSWIYVYNNECVNNINGKTTTMMEWLTAQSLNGNVSNMN